MDFALYVLGNHNPIKTPRPRLSPRQKNRKAHMAAVMSGENRSRNSSEEWTREEGRQYLLRAPGPKRTTKAKAMGLNWAFTPHSS